MLQIDDTIISLDVLESQFICNLSKCKGECCVDGDSGAPLENDENVVVFGEDAGYEGGVFRVTAGLQKKYGKV